LGRSYLLGGGSLYLVLILAGRIVDPNRFVGPTTPTSGVLVDDAGGWLQLGAAGAMITLGAVLGRTPTRDADG
jgi:hypothetical protein